MPYFTITVDVQMLSIKKNSADGTRERLLDAAECIFLKHGVAKATLEQIVTEAGFSRGAAYWHFQNKHEIFEEIYKRAKLPMNILLHQLLSAPQISLNDLKRLCNELFQRMASNHQMRNLLTIIMQHSEEHRLQREPYTKEFKERQAELVTQFEAAFVRIGDTQTFPSNITPKFAAMALHSFIYGILRDYVCIPGYDLEHLSPMLVDRFFVGLLDTPQLQTSGGFVD